MTTISTLFHQGGPTMFWIVVLIMPGLALSILHIVLHRGWTRWAALGLLAVVLAVGLYGRAKGHEMTERAAAGMESAYKEEMIEEGYKESSRPLQFALLVDGILGVGVIIGELRRRAARAA